MATPNLQSNKDRIIAVDLTRLLAAFIVMYEHLSFLTASDSIRTYLKWEELLIHRASPIFFFFAGYFACRNITWKKAIHNAFWCWAPFVLWNTIYIVCLWVHNSPFLNGQSLISLFGLSGLVHGYSHGNGPINVPLWFMRDLIFLFLLSPVLFKIAKYILLLIIILAICPATTYLTAQNDCIVLSLSSLGFFSLGCFMQSLSKETQKKLLASCSPVFLVVYAACMTVIHFCINVWGVLPAFTEWGFVQDVFGLLLLYNLARWVEIHFPKLKPLILKLAPVTFLTFAGHLIVYHELRDFLKSSYIMLFLLPIITFAFFACFFFLLKRFAPCLLHLVAHYKLRAEDVSQKQSPAKSAG